MFGILPISVSLSIWALTDNHWAKEHSKVSAAAVQHAWGQGSFTVASWTPALGRRFSTTFNKTKRCVSGKTLWFPDCIQSKLSPSPCCGSGLAAVWLWSSPLLLSSGCRRLCLQRRPTANGRRPPAAAAPEGGRSKRRRFSLFQPRLWTGS